MTSQGLSSLVFVPQAPVEPTSCLTARNPLCRQALVVELLTSAESLEPWPAPEFSQQFFHEGNVGVEVSWGFCMWPRTLGVLSISANIRSPNFANSLIYWLTSLWRPGKCSASCSLSWTARTAFPLRPNTLSLVKSHFTDVFFKQVDVPSQGC